MDDKLFRSSTMNSNEMDFYDPCHECKKEYINLENIKEIGYYFDDDGILRYIKDNSPFPFKSLLVPLFKVRYDIFRTLTAKHVRQMLSDIGIISEIVYTPKLPNGLRILHSKNLFNHTGPLMIIIQAGGVTRAGVWSPRLLMHTSGGINVASQLNQLKRSLDNNYAVLVINPNERIITINNNYSKDEETSPEEIIHSIWKNLIPKCKASKILIWAHMYGGTAFLYPLQPPPNINNLRKSSIDSYSNHLSTKYYSKYLQPSSYSSDTSDIISSNLNCVAMDFATSKILTKQHQPQDPIKLDNNSKLLASFSSKSSSDQTLLYPVTGGGSNEFKTPPICHQKPPSKYLQQQTMKQNREEMMETLPDLSGLTNLQQIIDSEGQMLRNNNNSNNIDLLFSTAKSSCNYLDAGSGSGSGGGSGGGKKSSSLENSCHTIDISTNNRKSSNLRKRTSISSNNATDNSSIHSDNSVSGFSNSSSKQQRCFTPSFTDFQKQKPKPNSESPFQKKLNEKWDSRRKTFWKSIQDKVAGILFTDSAICLKMQGIMMPEIHEWFKENAVHYVACTEELGSDLNKSSFNINEIPTKSAGTAEHDIIPHVITDEAFLFFQNQLNKTGVII